MPEKFNPDVQRAEPKAERNPVGIYKNISNVKLHTSMGVIWPGKEVILGPEEAEVFGPKLMALP